MNVLNATELEFNVFIEILVLVAFAGRPVCHGIYLRINQNGNGVSFNKKEREKIDRDMNNRLTLGLVSTTYINLALGLAWTIPFNSCSSSTQRALNPDRG
jgi:hypothetical protein